MSLEGMLNYSMLLVVPGLYSRSKERAVNPLCFTGDGC